MQRILAIAALTVKAAFRYRLVLVLAGLLVASVVVLPIIIKHDGTARGFTQILMTYTLSAMTALLGFATLWLGCGSLAREVEECQMQMVAVKPIARWQIWLGKWLGILGVNALLLGVSSVAVYALMQWRASQLPADQQEVLRNEVFVARASAKQPMPDIEPEVERRFRLRMQEDPVAPADRKLVRDQIREQLKHGFQLTPPGYMRPWRVDVGVTKEELRGKPLYVRVKFFTSDYSMSGTFPVAWEVGPPNYPRPFVKEMSLAPETFHEFNVPSELLDENGVLFLRAYNLSQTVLLFTLEEGIEVLYPEGGFTLNFFRGIAIIFCWLALLAALGLAASSSLSFPVASFLALSVLILCFSTGTMSGVIEQGGFVGIDHDTGVVSKTGGINQVIVLVFKSVLGVISLVKSFSPVNLLSTGRSITWGMLGQAILQICVLAGGVCAAIGIVLFTRRELATAQGNQ